MSYSRYIIGPRSFWKTWMSHIDAYPLMAANAAGCVLVAFFGYRKMFKHPDNRWQTGEILTPEADGSWDDEYVMSRVSDWVRWMRQFEHKMGIANENIRATSSWTSTTNKGQAELIWDRANMSYAPSNSREYYEEILRIPIQSSFLQKMTNMEEVETDDILAVAKNYEKEIKTGLEKQLLSQDDKVALLNLLGKHADVLELEYKIATANSELGESSNVKSFINQLRSFSNDTTYTEGAWESVITTQHT